MKPTPMQVYDELSKQKFRPEKLKNLAALHELCREQYDSGSRDFSLFTIRCLCDERGFMKGRGLYNEAAADYRKLIDAWQGYAGPAPVKQKKPPTEGLEWLMRIPDPAVRSLIQTVFIERRQLAAENQTLKNATKFVVDKRPVIDNDLPSPKAKVKLTPSEMEALGKAVAPMFLEDEGWREGPQGQIFNERGRVVFEPGYATGIRKVLAAFA